MTESIVKTVYKNHGSLVAIDLNGKATQRYTCSSTISLSHPKFIRLYTVKEGWVLTEISEASKYDTQVFRCLLCISSPKIWPTIKGMYLGYDELPAKEEPKFSGDKNYIMKLIEKDGNNLRYASRKLRNDPEVVMTAICKTPEAVIYMSDELAGNKEFLKKYMKCSTFKLTPEFIDLVSDDEELLEGVTGSVELVSERLRGDKNLMSSVGSLEHLSYELRDDEEFARMIINKNPDNLKWASARLRCSSSFISSLSEIRIQYVSPELLTDLEFVKNKLTDRDLIYLIRGGYIQPDNRLVQYIPFTMCVDCDKMLKLISADISNFQYVAAELLVDDKFINGLKKITTFDVEKVKHLIDVKWLKLLTDKL